MVLEVGINVIQNLVELILGDLARVLIAAVAYGIPNGLFAKSLFLADGKQHLALVLADKLTVRFSDAGLQLLSKFRLKLLLLFLDVRFALVIGPLLLQAGSIAIVIFAGKSEDGLQGIAPAIRRARSHGLRLNVDQGHLEGRLLKLPGLMAEPGDRTEECGL